MMILCSNVVYLCSMGFKDHECMFGSCWDGVDRVNLVRREFRCATNGGEKLPIRLNGCSLLIEWGSLRVKNSRVHSIERVTHSIEWTPAALT